MPFLILSMPTAFTTIHQFPKPRPYFHLRCLSIPASQTAPSAPNRPLSKSVISCCVFPISENGSTNSVPHLEISKLAWDPCLLPSQPRSSWSKVLRILPLQTSSVVSAQLCFQPSITSCLDHCNRSRHTGLPASPSVHFPHGFQGNLLKTPSAQSYLYSIIYMLKTLQWFPITFRMKSKILGLV